MHAHRRCSSCALRAVRVLSVCSIGVMIGWVLLMVGWDNGASLCADAVDNDNKPFTAFSNALAFALSYFAVVLVAIIIGTLIRKLSATTTCTWMG